MIRRAFIVCCAAGVAGLFSSACLRAAEPVGEAFVYRKVDGRGLKLYVTRPDATKFDGARPAILFFHGGGWVGGKPGQFTEHSKHLAARGMVAVQVEYRLLDRKNNDPPTICIEDAVAAMRWVRLHAEELKIDVKRVASAGGSAGGHLAAYLGTIVSSEPQAAAPNFGAFSTRVSAKPNAMVLFNPVYDNGPEGWGYQRTKDRYGEFSPMHNISPDDPPHIVFLGDQDKLIPVATAKAFQQKMTEAGVRSELKIYAGQAHGFFNVGRDGNRWYRETIGETDRFLTSLGWLPQVATARPD